ncbi:MAG: CIA30 family protein [Phormidesmis sp.]
MATNKQPQWDAARLLSTLSYFGEIPFIGSFRWLQQLMGQNTVVPGMNLNAMKAKVAVVSSGYSKQLRRLQAQAAPSTDLFFYEPQLGSVTSLEQADNLSSDLKALIRMSDTVIMLDVHQYSALMSDFVGYCQENSEFSYQSIFDFSMADFDLSAWGALDDVVMGGLSQGSFFMRGQQAVFAGNVSTGNSGGFSSVRTQNFNPPFDCSGWRGMRLKVLGDGQRYKFILRDREGWDTPAYIYGFNTAEGEWTDVAIPFDQMVPTFRAKSVPDAPAFDPAKVYSIQLMLSKFEYDRRLNPDFTPGPFELAVKEIGVYRPRQGVRLIIVGNQGESVKLREQLDQTQIDYRFIESENENWVSEISQILSPDAH